MAGERRSLENVCDCKFEILVGESGVGDEFHHGF